MGVTFRSFIIKTLGLMSGLMLLVTVPMIALHILLWVEASRTPGSRRGWHDEPALMALLLASLSVPILWSLLNLGVVIPLQARRPAWTGTAILAGLVTLLGIAPVFPERHFFWGIHGYYSVENSNGHLIEDLVPLFEELRNGTDHYIKYRIYNTIDHTARAEASLYSMSQGLSALGGVMWIVSWIILTALIIVTLMSIGSCLLARQTPDEPGSLAITVAGRRFYLKWGREGEIALPRTSEDLAPTEPVASNTTT